MLMQFQRRGIHLPLLKRTNTRTQDVDRRLAVEKDKKNRAQFVNRKLSLEVAQHLLSPYSFGSDGRPTTLPI